MPKNRISLGMDLRKAVQEMEDAPEAVEDGASNTVKQLAVLAEGAMKDEAPEGAGRDTHMRDTIDTRFRRGGMTANVGARKRVRDGGLLAEIIVEGTDPSSYTPSQRLASFLGTQMRDWAAAKTGDPSNAYAIAWSIIRGGHETLPNNFVDRSRKEWESQVEDIAGDNIREALARLMAGGG